MKSKKFSIVDAYQHGWHLTVKNFWFVFGLMFCVMLVTAGVGRIPPLAFLAAMFVSISIISAALGLYGGKKVQVGNLFEKYHMFLSYLVASIFYGILVIVGLILLIVPGIYFAIKYQFYKILVIDKEMDPVEALKKSGDITKGHMWELLVFMLSAVGMNLVGALVFGVGLFVSVPVTLFATIYIYKKLLA